MGRCNVVQLRSRFAPIEYPPCPDCAHRGPAQGGGYAGVLLLLPGLVLLNGLSPYLGLKTRTAWQMYSNLNLSPLIILIIILIPYSLDVGGFLADSVRILATSDPVLCAQAYVQTGRRITWFELRRLCRASIQSSELTYTRPGPRVPQGRLGRRRKTHREKAPAGGECLEKLLIFRPLGATSAGVCDW